MQRAHHEIVVSNGVMAEYREVVQRPKMERASEALKRILYSIAVVGSWVEPATKTFGLVDPDDEIFLQTAVAGSAVALVTGNKRHFPAARYAGIEILAPAAFLDRVR